jgi:hypothetical protein
VTFEEASIVAIEARAELSEILSDWIAVGDVLYVLPMATLGDDDVDHYPLVEVHILPQLPTESKLSILHAAQPLVDSGVLVTMIWSEAPFPSNLTRTLH